jgi:hypothetical protein
VVHIVTGLVAVMAAAVAVAAVAVAAVSLREGEIRNIVCSWCWNKKKNFNFVGQRQIVIDAFYVFYVFYVFLILVFYA